MHKNKYLEAIDNFTKKCMKIEGIHDVLLRGTSTDLENVKENWSDIDFFNYFRKLFRKDLSEY